ncbi:MAG: hypothetical protein ACOYN5_02680 [Bacteroidales bacterium]
MKAYFLKIVSIILIVNLVASCDPGFAYSKVIQNDSDFDVIIRVHGASIDYSADSFYVSKRSEEAILLGSGLGQTFEFEDCNLYADSLTASVADTDTMKVLTELNDLSNWTFTVLNKTFKGGGTCECRIIINDDQIE